MEDAPLDKHVLLCWRPVDHVQRPWHREWVIGTFSSHRPGKVWANGRYYDIETHIVDWQELPPLPARRPPPDDGR